METEQNLEQQLRNGIEQLRAQFPNTQDLYREACALLFFRFGITPTANMLYQLVKKGSMSAPAEALSKFWNDLRQKSRIRIEHPDLPDDLKASAGELVATLWSKAQGLAQDNFSAYRAEAQASVSEIKAALAKAEIEGDAMRQQFEEDRQLLAEAKDHIATLEQNLASEHAMRYSSEQQLEQASARHTELQHALESARRDFGIELSKLRASAQLAEERLRASEERALREIDRERTLAAKLQKELNTVRATADQSLERHRAEVADIQTQLGDLRQNTGVLEGNLQSLEANRDRLTVELEAVRQQLTHVSAQATSARVEAENWRRLAEEAKLVVAKRKTAGRAKPKSPSNRSPRKSKASV